MSAISQLFKKIGDAAGFRSNSLMSTDANKNALLLPFLDNSIAQDTINSNRGHDSVIRVNPDGSGYSITRALDKIHLKLNFSGTTTNNWWRTGDAGIPTHQSPFMFDKTYYVKKVFFSNRSVNSGMRLRVRSTPETDTGNVATSDPIAFDILSSDAQVVKDIGPGKNLIWIDNGTREKRVTVDRRYGFRLERTAGANTWNDSHMEIEFEEYVT